MVVSKAACGEEPGAGRSPGRQGCEAIPQDRGRSLGVGIQPPGKVLGPHPAPAV